jgi:hypothetical protein
MEIACVITVFGCDMACNRAPGAEAIAFLVFPIYGD